MCTKQRTIPFGSVRLLAVTPHQIWYFDGKPPHTASRLNSEDHFASQALNTHSARQHDHPTTANPPATLSQSYLTRSAYSTSYSLDQWLGRLACRPTSNVLVLVRQNLSRGCETREAHGLGHVGSTNWDSPHINVLHLTVPDDFEGLFFFRLCGPDPAISGGSHRNLTVSQQP